ncbi:MAG: MFS transporter, partial [Trebonia sp.]
MWSARFAVSAHFLVMGLTGGVWMARVPAAKSQVHLSDGTLGIALLAVPVGLVLGAALAERLVDRVGSRVLCRICGVGSCVAVATPGLAHTLPALMAALFVIGVFGGTLDVSSNAQGVRVEAAYARPVMTSMHAFYSLGAILGSLVGGGLAWAGVGLFATLSAVGLIGAVVDGAAGRWLLPETRRTATAATSGAHSAATATATNDSSTSTGTIEPGDTPVPAGITVTTDVRDARRRVRRLVLALGVLGVCGLVGEGAAGDWSAVYLTDNLGTSAGLAALGFAAFSATMTIGRGVGDR